VRRLQSDSGCPRFATISAYLHAARSATAQDLPPHGAGRGGWWCATRPPNDARVLESGARSMQQRGGVGPRYHSQARCSAMSDERTPRRRGLQTTGLASRARWGKAAVMGKVQGLPRAAAPASAGCPQHCLGQFTRVLSVARGGWPLTARACAIAATGSASSLSLSASAGHLAKTWLSPPSAPCGHCNRERDPVGRAAVPALYTEWGINCLPLC
jgi:hypothetical protein